MPRAFALVALTLRIQEIEMLGTVSLGLSVDAGCPLENSPFSAARHFEVGIDSFAIFHPRHLVGSGADC